MVEEKKVKTDILAWVEKAEKFLEGQSLRILFLLWKRVFVKPLRKVFWPVIR